MEALLRKQTAKIIVGARILLVELDCLFEAFLRLGHLTLLMSDVALADPCLAQLRIEIECLLDEVQSLMLFLSTTVDQDAGEVIVVGGLIRLQLNQPLDIFLSVHVTLEDEGHATRLMQYIHIEHVAFVGGEAYELLRVEHIVSLC